MGCPPIAPEVADQELAAPEVAVVAVAGAIERDTRYSGCRSWATAAISSRKSRWKCSTESAKEARVSAFSRSPMCWLRKA
jgi:hypothetical protein